MSEQINDPYVLRVDVGPTREEWCDGCMTSSLVACDLTRITDVGVSLLGSFRKCWRCCDLNAKAIR